MKKVIIVFTGIYFKFNPETKERKVLYNYVVTDGDAKAYSADKDATGHLSLQTQSEDGSVKPEHIGLPRFVSQTDLGATAELQRIQKQDGTHDWYTDDTEKLLVESAVKSLPEFAKQAFGKELAMEAIANARATASRIKALKNATVDADLSKK